MTSKGAKLALAGVAISLGALGMAGQANADEGAPVDPLVVANPGAPLPQGVPVLEEGAPPAQGEGGGNFNPSMAVGKVADDQAHYGSGSGPLGFLRDAWHQAKDPYNFGGTPQGEFPVAEVPAGAGPAPKLPPGYVSTNAPGSETPMPAKDLSARPAPPPGYARTESGMLAPIPGYVDPAVAAAPPPYVPRHSDPPPPLLPEDPGPPPLFG